jgi:hypothetical protein
MMAARLSVSPPIPSLHAHTDRKRFLIGIVLLCVVLREGGPRTAD